QIRVLDDGRRVTLRHAVPSDAPRLVLLLGSAFASEDDRVALDDHGIIVGHVVGTSEPVVSEAWLESELAVLLADPRSEGQPRPGDRSGRAARNRSSGRDRAAQV